MSLVLKITVASDGLVFNNLLEVEEREVFDYKEISLDMAKTADAPVEILDLNDFYFHGNTKGSREMLYQQFGIDETKLRALVLTDSDTNMLRNGMIRFMEQELATNTYVSNNQRHKAAKALADKMMLANEAYSALVKQEFKTSIRLSMHPSENNGNKFSFQLIEGKPENIWASPWHCAIVLDPIEGAITMHRIDAELHNYDLVTKDNQPYYFIANN